VVSCELDVVDCFGNRVQLAHSNWEKHIRYRPEIEPHHDLLPLTLADPDLVIRADRLEDNGSHAYHFFRSGSWGGTIAGTHMHVITAYNVGGDGYVKSVWFQRRPYVKGVIVYQRGDPGAK
jgi:hypothetical protein